MSKELQTVLSDAYEYARAYLGEGRVASYIPELSKANPANLGVYLKTKEGESFGFGDFEIPFTIQSIGKTFALILALETAGYDAVFSKVGMEPSGDSFDSIIQLEMKNWNPYNPLINCGAIATVSCIRSEKPFEDYIELVRKLCGDPKVRLNEDVYLSEKRTGDRNRAIAYLLKSDRVLEANAEDVLDLYFRMCSVLVTAKGLANYALILANGGKDPGTGEQLVSGKIVRTLRTLMLLCGMYDESGEYAVRVGIPSKSGVGGGIVAVPGNGCGIATYGPVLNRKGNSVGGEKILEYLSEKLDLHIIRQDPFPSM
ncbi:MAG: glutaminase A [Stomatobaculum sp.]|nr:glutaminase A [Stomatobaculum sp.]